MIVVLPFMNIFLSTGQSRSYHPSAINTQLYLSVTHSVSLFLSVSLSLSLSFFHLLKFISAEPAA